MEHLEAMAQLAAIVDSSDDAIISKDLTGTIKSWNAGAERLFGYTSDEVTGKNISLLIPADRLGEEPKLLERIRRGERVEHYQTIRQRKDGRLVEISLSLSPVRDAKGEVVGAAKIAREIGEQKRADMAVRRLAAIVESSDDAIVSKKLDGIIDSWNFGAERLFGYSAGEAIGMSVMKLIPEDRQNEEPEILDQIRRGQRVDHYETVRRRKDGSLVEVSLSVSPMRDETGKIVGASKIARDISDQRRARQALEAANEALQNASRAKDDFLAALSHELRTPLNPALLLASNGAEDATFPQRARDDFLTIRKNIELEARLIDDLLDITRITRGRLPLIHVPQDAHSIITDAVATVRDEIGTKKLILQLSMHASQPLITGDAVRLQQVIWNLLKNAVKFTPEGGRISVVTQNDDVRGKFIIRVSDTGIGITEAEQARLFDAFVQGEHATGGGSHRFGGLGLGLTISRLLTELHQGTLSAESEGRGRGASFTIELPLLSASEVAAYQTRKLCKAESVSAAAAEGRHSNRATILLVEDHGPTRESLGRLLSNRKFNVLLAANGREAREKFDAAPVQILISDIGLPDTTGYELMAELGKDRELIGIALTGYGMENDVVLSQKAGFTSHLTKPVTIQAIDQVLAVAVEKLK